MLRSWPQEGLRPETCTVGFEDIISEIAQFESQRLGILFTLKSILLEIHDELSSTPNIEIAEPQPHLAPFLDMRPPLKWGQLILPAALTHSLLKLTTLHDTFGLFSKIAEIFLFTLQPEGFIMTGQYPGLSPLHTQYHPFGEGHGHASTALGPVQGMGYGVQPVLMQLQGQHWTSSRWRILDQRQVDKRLALS